MTTGWGRRVAAGIVRGRAALFLAWIGAMAAVIPLGNALEERLVPQASIEGSESLRTEMLLKDRFHSPFAETAILAVTGTGAPDSAMAWAVLGDIADAVAGTDGVTGTLSYRDTRDPFFAGEGGTLLLAGLDTAEKPEAVVSRLREKTQNLEADLRARLPDMTLRWTGATALNSDLRRVSAEQAQMAELQALPLILAVLLFAFGLSRMALLPVLTGPLAIAMALGAVGLVAQHFSLSVLVINVVTMVGLGLSIDYALLIVSRFQEARRDGLPQDEAAITAARHAGKTVSISGLAVAIGFAGLLFMPLDELRSIGIGGMIVATVAVLIATTLIPGLLSSRLFRGRGKVQKQTLPSHRFWLWWGRFVSRFPKTILVVAAIVPVALAIKATDMTTELSRDNWLPQGVESVRALDDLAAMGRRNVVQTIRVVAELPAQVEDETLWDALTRIETFLARDARVAQIRSLPSIAGSGNAAAIGFLPDAIRDSFLGRDGKTALIEIVPREQATPAEAIQLVRDLRTIDAGALSGIPGTILTVGGIPAFNTDYEDIAAGRLPVIILLVVCGTFAVFAIAYRSVLIPIKAIALNLLSVAASLGAVVLVFQDGHGAALFGLSEPLGGVFPIVPALVFCTVFGLSIDYEAFLLGRLTEARGKGMDDATALSTALAQTGSIITSAAAIMICVFAAFMLGDFVLIKMLGFALVVAVVIDATLVRLALGPALIMVSGRWNWWPSERDPGRRALANAAAAASR